HENRIVRNLGGALVGVPGRDEVLDEREEAHPRRNPAGPDGKRPSGQQRGRDGVLRGGRRGLRAWRSVIARRGAVARRVVARPFSVPRDRLDLVREVPPRRLDGGEEAAGEIVEEGQAEENIRLRDEGGGGRERGGFRERGQSGFGRRRQRNARRGRTDAERGDPP